MTKSKPAIIRVLVVDSSPTMRDLLAALLNQAGGLHVIGNAANGEEAVRLVKRLRPDVVTMDIHMPKMDGLDAIRQIMRDHPVPIVIISASKKPHDMELTFQALRTGALTVLDKPGLNDPETSQQIIQTVRLMAGVPVIHHWGRSEKLPAPTTTTIAARPLASPPVSEDTKIELLRSRLRVIGIAASTGGPSAVAAVLRNLPANFPLPIVLVQHFSPGFAGGLAEWLGTQTNLQVEIAAHGNVLQPGVVLMAPDDYHVQVTTRGGVELSKAPAYKGLRPSANPLFASLATSYGRRAMGIILTGMGDDGSDGLALLHQAGGYTIGQDAESCVVYGMPHEAAIRNATDEELSPEQIGWILEQLAPPTIRKESVV